MTPPIPFGNSTRQGILRSFDILDPIASALPGLKRSLSLDLSLPESGYVISLEGSGARVVFSYALDDDPDATNGRLILRDTFQLQINNKKLLYFKREVESTNDETFWMNAAARLNKLKNLDARNKTVKKFFNEVVKDLELVPVEVQKEINLPPFVMNDDVSMMPEKILPQIQYLPRRLSASLTPVSAKYSVLLNRARSQIKLSRTQKMLDGQLFNYVATASNPEMIVCLFGGSLGFQLGRTFASSFHFKSLAVARLTSTAVGLSFEAPAFEVTSRAFRALTGQTFQSESFVSSLPRHYLTFGAFRFASLLSRSTLATFAALHGVNEFERRLGLRPGLESDYIHRVVEDGILFSQLIFASHLSEVALAKSLGNEHVIHEKLIETELSAYRAKRVIEEVPVVSPPARLAEPKSPSLPKNFLPKLIAEEPVLATQLPDANGVHLRELVDHRLVDGFGGISAFTKIGLDKAKLNGKRDFGINEDAMGYTLDAQGNLVLIVCDGVGGSKGGEVASQIAVESVVEAVRKPEAKGLGEIALELDAHLKTQTTGETVIGALRILPDASVEHMSVGDIRLWLIRSLEDGSRRVYEPRLPHTLSGALRKGLNTVAFNAHPWSNVVLSGLGGPKDRRLEIVRELDVNREGQIFHQARLQINEGTPQNPIWKDLVLRAQDDLILMSDGVAGQLDEAQLLSLTSARASAAENLSALQNYTLEALRLFEWVYQARVPKNEKAKIPLGFIFEGKLISPDGKIFEPDTLSGEAGNLIAHVSADNVTAIWYRHNPKNEMSMNDAAGAPPVPLSPPQNLPLGIPPPPHRHITLNYAGRSQRLESSHPSGILIGRNHQVSLFPSERSWIQGEHFKIEYVQVENIWRYRLTSLVDSGLWIENQLSGTKKFLRILQKGESHVLEAQTYELKFKRSEREWDESFFLELPPIQITP